MAARLQIGSTKRGKPVFLSAKDRTTHMQVVGGSDRGKSKLLEYMIRQDVLHGEGLCVIDPHGKLTDDLLAWLATHDLDKKRKIHLFEPAGEGWRIGFNPLHLRAGADSATMVDSIVTAIAQVWGGEDSDKTPRLDRILGATLFALISKNLTLLEATDLLNPDREDAVRRYISGDIQDAVYGPEWRQHLNTLPSTRFLEQVESTRNRLMRLLASPYVRSILGQQEHIIDFRRCMDRGEIVLINLSSSPKFSLPNARLIGTLMVNDLLQKALGRPAGSRPFYLYIDECYRYLNKDIEDILDQCRKFGLHLILSHQRVGQLREAGEGVYNAVMGGTHTKVVFGGLQIEDSEEMAREVIKLDLEQPKHTFDKPTVVDYVPEWMLSESETESETEGYSTGSSDGTSSSTTETTLGEEWEPSSTTESSSRSASENESSSYSRSRSQTAGRSQTLRPVLKVMPTQGKSLDEVTYEAAHRLKEQRPRIAVMKAPARVSCTIQVPKLRPGVARAERVTSFRERLLSQSDFASSVQFVDQEQSLRAAKVRELAQERLMPLEPADFMEG